MCNIFVTLYFHGSTDIQNRAFAKISIILEFDLDQVRNIFSWDVNKELTTSKLNIIAES